MPHPTLALIIPVGPGDDSWIALLPWLRQAQLDIGAGSPPRVIFSACVPRPSRPEIQPTWDWLVGEPGRAAQLNRGAAAASAEWLWFMHADSRPAKDALPALRASIAARPQALHWFPLAFHDGSLLTRLNALGANWRSRRGLPFGDQGLCLRRSDLDRLGGFDVHFGRGEDLALVVRARQAGIELAEVASTISTSARRYRQQGWLRTTIEHWWLTRRMLARARRSPSA
ncbi:MAG: glycosyltransferase [Xanthomonadales bacterium]|nr:glycosyltransferase [Xanthomonadales bacterium]MCB1635116.1 glycosyltransferase [Xanthomonadales bacterium]